jgi:hypothetical protein
MPTFYDRYRAGEHQQVWSELVSLGEAVRQEPVCSDAVAVARETMRRARTNIETLINRLHALGYRFATEPTSAQQSLERIAALAKQVDAFRANAQGPFAGMMKGLLDRVTTATQNQQAVEQLKASAAKPARHPIEDRSVYGRAMKDSPRQIADAESFLRGPLPISLRAWYEEVEHVSFLGSHPTLNPASAPARPTMFVAPSMLKGPGADERRRLAESLGFGVTSEMPESPLDQSALPDPLVVFPLEEVLDVDEAGGGSFIISPDDLQKANISGDMYYVDLPDRRADVEFQDWEKGCFVSYLRRVFAWGGFPGWARHRNPPTRLIQELARDLEPL